MTVTAITPPPLEILVISSCDLYYPLKKLIAHHLITLILDLGASIPWRGWERASGLGVNMQTLVRIPSQERTNSTLVLA